MMSSRFNFHLGIDATNLSQGRGLTYLTQLLRFDPNKAGIEHVTVWCSSKTGRKLPSAPWLTIRSPRWASSFLSRRVLGQLVQITQEVKRAGCHIFFAPGGVLSPFLSLPTISMSQNMLPFERKEALLFGKYHFMYLKFCILKQMQVRSFRRANGVIFLTEYAKKRVSAVLGEQLETSALIPHGIEPRFIQASPLKPQKNIFEYTDLAPFKLLYVSIVMPYKHQCEVAQAVYQLKKEGLPIEIKFVGALCGNYGIQFSKLIDRLDPRREYIHHIEEQSFALIHQYYHEADLFIFSSSCENLPNILIEAMAAGLAICCSDRGPMKEILGDAGGYFNPYSSESIADRLREFILNPELRSKYARMAQEKSRIYSWENCANETYKFISRVVGSRRC